MDEVGFERNAHVDDVDAGVDQAFDTDEVEFGVDVDIEHFSGRSEAKKTANNGSQRGWMADVIISGIGIV